jgi:1,4-dihydroxy-6-naphthoate synthase
MNLTLGFSPCPNDCFIFDALVHNRIDTKGITFTPEMLDVEALNKKAFNGELDITKLSYFAFFHVMENYALLRSGSALGFNCGPLLISKKVITQETIKSGNVKIAIPGKFTTANFLLSLAFPFAQQKTEMLFSDIEQAVLDEQVDAGLIIHENRFTYQHKGLKKIIDLGEYWESLIQSPIPLGGIAMRRNFDRDLISTVEELIRNSVEYAFQHPEASEEFVKLHAQEMHPQVIQQHIKLYVNEFSIDLGNVGANAVQVMLREARKKNLLPSYAENQSIF